MSDSNLPKSWEEVLNAPLRWIRRVPRRLRGVVLFALVLLVGIPVVWKGWESIVDRLAKGYALSFLVLPHHDVPYGMAYFPGAGKELESVRAYPIYNVDMHQAVAVQPLAEIKDVIRDAYRITIGNPTDRKFLVTGVTMHVRRYEKLPPRYVCVWKRKGLQQVLTADFDLKPETRQATLLDEQRIIELPPGEAQVVLARVRDAVPGLYTFYFTADAQSVRGKTFKLTSEDFRLLVPNRTSGGATPRGVSIATADPSTALVKRFLDLQPAGWQKLCDASNPRSLDAALAASRGFTLKVGVDDAELVQQFVTAAAVPDPGVMRPISDVVGDCVEGRDDAAPCADTLISLGQPDQALRVLRDGLARNPGDPAAGAKLIEILIARNENARAKEVWDQVSARAGPNDDLYAAGFTLARATSDVALADRLARESAMQFPDSLILLEERTLFYRTHGRAADALHALAAGCRNLDVHPDTAGRRFLRRVVRDTIILMSNRGSPEVGAWLPVILNRCPSQIAWDLRSSPALWHYASMQRPFARPPASSKEGLERARALIASGRLRQAGRELGYVDRTGTPAGAAEARELFGDVLYGNGEYERAGNMYLRAFRDRSLPKVQMEGILVKAALAYYHVRSPRVMDVFEAAGHRLMRAADLPNGVARQLGQPKPEQRVLDQPVWAAPQSGGLVLLVRGFATGDHALAEAGFVIALTSEPVFELGQAAGDIKSRDFYMPLARTIGRWGRSKNAVPALSNQMIDYYAKYYIREERFFAKDETVVDSEYAGRYEAANAALVMLKETQLDTASVFFVRVRGGMTFGTSFPSKEEVFTDAGWFPFEQWKARLLNWHRRAKPGVYLEKLTGSRLEAEQLFRHGLERAYRDYEVQEGLDEIERAIAQDDTNVEALRVAAQLSAALAQPRRCAELAQRGVVLDPDAEHLSKLAAACQGAIRRPDDAGHPGPVRD